MIYKCTDGNCEIEIEAESPDEAAQEYVDGGDYQTGNTKTTWVTVYVRDEEGELLDRVKIDVDPIEPKCGYSSKTEHDWQQPLSIVGGCKENPGVHGSGGGVAITSACVNCGCAKIVNTWDWDPVDGEQGLESIEYKPGFYRDELEELQSSEEEEN